MLRDPQRSGIAACPRVTPQAASRPRPSSATYRGVQQLGWYSCHLKSSEASQRKGAARQTEANQVGGAR